MGWTPLYTASLGRGYVVSARSSVRPGSDSLGVGHDPNVRPCPARAGVRGPVDDRLRRRAHRPWVHRGVADAHGALCDPDRRSGVIGIGMGGDHSVTLAELRALAEVHGRLGLVQLDAHIDLHDTYNDLPYSHGTMFRRTIIEDVLDPARVIQQLGSLYSAEDQTSPPTSRLRQFRGSSWHFLVPKSSRHERVGASAAGPRS